MSAYATSDDVVVYLINQSVNGSPDRRRLAARFILNCLRIYETPEEFEACFHNLEDHAILDVAKEAREMAKSVGLIR
jgi:hypothetical protein